MSDKVVDARSFQELFLATWRLASVVRRNHRHTAVKLICTTVLAFTMTAAGRDPAESFLRQGNRLVDKGLFAEAVAAYTRALQQNPNEVKVYWYRALANEMVDRQAAIGDWRQFAESAAADSRLKEAVAQAQQRAQALEKIPVLPDLLRPSRYVPKARDYYHEVAGPSVGLEWTEFPVKVFADNPPEEWRRAVQEALDAWTSVFPLQTVSTREKADIVLSWAKSPQRIVGTEGDSIQVRKEDDRVVSRRKESFIILDYSHRWSDHEMRGVVLHELGHALGIGGHSDGSRDVMFPEEVNIIEVSKTLAPWGASVSSGVSSSTRINAKLTPRDVNTLIRLYNCPGPLVHLK
jgi:predicted Zn-dependent protease